MDAQSTSARIRSALRRSFAAGVAALSLAACAVPDVDTSIERVAPAADGKLEIHGASGPLSAEQSAAVLAKAGASHAADDAAGDGSLAAHLAIEQAVAGDPLVAENAVQVLRNGADTFRAMSAVMRAARHSINLEYYTIENVILDDNLSLLDLLVAKRQEGVAVNIVYDAYGSSDTPAEFWDRLKAAGVNLLPFHPLSDVFNLNNRDHRKILVADGETAILGGVNLSHSYESKAPGSSSREEREEHESLADRAAREARLGGATALTENLPDYWLDTAVRIEGPVVAQAQALFRDHWKFEKGPPLDEAGFFPPLGSRGHEVVRIIGSTPEQDISRYYVTVVSAMRNAKTRIWLSAAYFVPTPAEKDALIAAARRGVDVRLLLPGESDSEKALRAGETHYLDLLQGGVRIWQAHGVVLHSKCVVIDSVWSAIGSSNFDHRSVLFNDEVDAVILGTETAGELEQVLRNGAKYGTELDAKTWAEDRPAGERVRGFFTRFVEHQL